LRTFGVIKGSKTSATSGDFSGGLDFFTRITAQPNATKRLAIANNGDISFYEDTGTTAKLFWDASAEALRVGSTSAIFTNSKIAAVSALGPTIGGKQTTAAQSAGGFWNSDTGTVNLLSFYTGSGGTQIGSIAGTTTGVSLFGSGGNGLTVNSSGNVGIGTGSLSAGLLTLSGVDGSSIPGIYFNNTTASTGKSYRLNSGNSGEFMLYDITSSAYRIFVNTSGNVGIGTQDPKSTLEVKGTFGAPATSGFAQGFISRFSQTLGPGSLDVGFGDPYSWLQSRSSNDYATNYNLALQPNGGNVGIGTTNPIGDLTISNAGAEGIEFYAANGGNINATQHYNRSGSVYVTNKVIAADHQFLIGGTERMRLNSAGSLGLGTNNPSARLHLYNSSSDPINIGIQNSTRYYKLEVNSGDLQFFDISAYVERMRITSNGVLAVGAATTYQNGSSGVYGRLGVQHTTSQDVSTAVFLNKSNSLTNYTSTFTDGSYTSNTANYSFYTCFTGNGSTISDVEYYLRGDGNAYADGAWNGGGADYAEYFEWEDGNSGSEDRRGWSVVLVNEKIRRATSDDDASTIIGVISGNPGVVGDSDIQGKWKGKYLTDDFGTPIRENVQAYSWETTDAEGNITTHSMHEDRVPEGVTVPTVEENSTFTSTTVDRKRDNPAYVEGQEYVQREYRPEWDTVGLMGKLRILKTEQKGTNWIKMRDISDAVEEWLVR
jgi:hypothetical protein